MEQPQVYTVYLYDLPKVEYQSHRLARVMKEQAGIVLNDVPIIFRDIKKQFFKGFMKISCGKFEDYVEMCEKIRYFEICGKQCRALRFEKEITSKSKKNTFQDFSVVDHLHEKFDVKMIEDIRGIPKIKRQSIKTRFFNSLNYIAPVYNLYKILKYITQLLPKLFFTLNYNRKLQ